jgi:glutathione S-transferase
LTGNFEYDGELIIPIDKGGYFRSVRARNRQDLVPALELEGGEILTQSLAIIECLGEVHRDPALLPVDPTDRG